MCTIICCIAHRATLLFLRCCTVVRGEKADREAIDSDSASSHHPGRRRRLSLPLTIQQGGWPSPQLHPLAILCTLSILCTAQRAAGLLTVTSVVDRRGCTIHPSSIVRDASAWTGQGRIGQDRDPKHSKSSDATSCYNITRVYPARCSCTRRTAVPTCTSRGPEGASAGAATSGTEQRERKDGQQQRQQQCGAGRSAGGQLHHPRGDWQRLVCYGLPRRENGEFPPRSVVDCAGTDHAQMEWRSRPAYGTSLRLPEAVADAHLYARRAASGLVPDPPSRRPPRRLPLPSRPSRGTSSRQSSSRTSTARYACSKASSSAMSSSSSSAW